jgi:hypothetical protein
MVKVFFLSAAAAMLPGSRRTAPAAAESARNLRRENVSIDVRVELLVRSIAAAASKSAVFTFVLLQAIDWPHACHFVIAEAG